MAQTCYLFLVAWIHTLCRGRSHHWLNSMARDIWEQYVSLSCPFRVDSHAITAATLYRDICYVEIYVICIAQKQPVLTCPFLRQLLPSPCPMLAWDLSQRQHIVALHLPV